MKHFSDKKSIRYQLRKKRFQIFLRLFRTIVEKQGTVSILDLGGTYRYWEVFGEFIKDADYHVTIVNAEPPKETPKSTKFTHLVCDACVLPYADKSFDIVHSNSLIEHVGPWVRMERLAREIRRCGQAIFVQTPYYWFPYEPHFNTAFFHWIPEQVRAGILMHTSLGHHKRSDSVNSAMRSVQSAYLLDRKQFRALFPDAEITFEYLAVLPKSLVAISGETLLTGSRSGAESGAESW